jgi:hypothetical protein
MQDGAGVMVEVCNVEGVRTVKSYLFFICVVLGFELRASSLLAKLPTP